MVMESSSVGLDGCQQKLSVSHRKVILVNKNIHRMCLEDWHSTRATIDSMLPSCNKDG
jgi:hypothetical protein